MGGLRPGLLASAGSDWPQIAGAAYGFADMGPYTGGQAQYLRVPWADFNCLRLPDDARRRSSTTT